MSHHTKTIQFAFLDWYQSCFDCTWNGRTKRQRVLTSPRGMLRFDEQIQILTLEPGTALNSGEQDVTHRYYIDIYWQWYATSASILWPQKNRTTRQQETWKQSERVAFVFWGTACWSNVGNVWGIQPNGPEPAATFWHDLQLLVLPHWQVSKNTRIFETLVTLVTLVIIENLFTRIHHPHPLQKCWRYKLEFKVWCRIWYSLIQFVHCNSDASMHPHLLPFLGFLLCLLRRLCRLLPEGLRHRINQKPFQRTKHVTWKKNRIRAYKGSISIGIAGVVPASISFLSAMTFLPNSCASGFKSASKFCTVG